jgi:predicted DNA-binding transcriptional regulator AlpA
MSEKAEIFMPRLLRRKRGASYLGLSEATFDRFVKDGKLPPPKKLENFKAWDRYTLDRFVDALPLADDLSEDADRSEVERSQLDEILGT